MTFLRLDYYSFGGDNGNSPALAIWELMPSLYYRTLFYPNIAYEIVYQPYPLYYHQGKIIFLKGIFTPQKPCFCGNPM